MEELSAILWDYFGQQNELKERIKIAPEDLIRKPEALIRYEQSKELGIPYVEGGVVDQPFIWMQEHAVIAQFFIQWNAVQRALTESTNAS